MNNMYEYLLRNIINLVPASIYWKDSNGKYLGCNKYVLDMAGLSKLDQIVGKDDTELVWKENAREIMNNDKQVIENRKTITFEERALFKDGSIHYFFTVKTFLVDDDGSSIVLIGVSLDITAEKEAQLLMLENEKYKIEIEASARFEKVAKKMSHDIRNALSSLRMNTNAVASFIPESLRIKLNDNRIQIENIANTQLNYGQDKKKDSEGGEDKQPVLVFLALSQAFSDKEYQNSNLDIKFTGSFNSKCAFTCIKMQPTNFRRMISNLVNNAIESLEGKKGIISSSLDLDTDGKNVKIIIQDTGKGMPKEVIDKILNDQHVATDKKEGHGIGLSQIVETIKNNQGKLDIESKIEEGTKMILTFPMIEAPEWLAVKIKINTGDTVVILDDDKSIHGACDTRFSSYKKQIKVTHFVLGSEAIVFINRFKEKDKIFLLTDFELLKQQIDGINVIEQTNIKRTILVTSHYDEEKVRSRAIKLGIGILPKELAPDVPIEICKADKFCKVLGKQKQEDIVVIDDNLSFLNPLGDLCKSVGKTAALYCVC